MNDQIEQDRIPMLPVIMVILGAFMAMLDSSIVNISIPKMQAVFGASTTQIQWVVTVYSLTLGIVVPLTGYLPKRFGTKNVYLAALVLFTLGSALCGLAWSNGSMIAFRVIQAIGGGMLMPVGMSLLLRLFPIHKRGSAMGFVGMAMIVAPAIGPTLGGYITDYMNWRLIFYLNVPIGILDVLLIISSLRLPEGHDGDRVRFDLWGFVTSTIGFFSLLYAFSEAPSKGWNSAEIIGCLGLGTVFLAIFIIVELRVKEPMLNLRLLKNYNFTVALLSSTVLFTALFSGMFFIPLFEQSVVGLSALQTGLLLMPSALASALIMPISGKLFDKHGGKVMIPLGIAFMTIITYMLHDININSSITWLMWILVLRNVGIGFSMMPLNTAGIADIPLHEINQASAVSQTGRQVGSSIGTAILTTVMMSRNTFHFARSTEGITMGSPAAMQVQALQQSLIAQGASAKAAYGQALSMIMKTISQHAFASALDDVFLITAGLGALAVVMTLFLKGKSASRKARPEPTRDRREDDGDKGLHSVQPVFE